MNHRHLILSILSGFVIYGLTLFLSCANQERADSDNLNELADEVATDIDDTMPTEPENVVVDKTDEKPAQDENLSPPEELDLPSEEDLDKTASTSNQSTDSTQMPEDKDLDKTFAGSDSADASDKAGVEEDALGIPTDEELAKAPVYDSAPQDQPSDATAIVDDSDAPGGIDTATPAETQTFKKPKAQVSNWSGQSSLPSIPGAAFSKQGKMLNRFYFLRVNDTPDAVSTLIYQGNQNAQALMDWNPGKWVPGKVIYYASPSSSDTQMLSLYQERNLAPQQHVVAAGETLSLIAKKRLGHVQSWKEIAIVNGMNSADALEKDQKLIIFTSLEAPAQTADSQGQPSPTESSQTPSPAPTVQEDSSLQFSPPPPVQAQVKEASKPERKLRRGMNLIKIVTQNLFFFAVGGTILLLLVALVALNRRRKSRALADDIFDEPARKI